jgi:hypothetical protein
LGEKTQTVDKPIATVIKKKRSIPRIEAEAELQILWTLKGK